MKCLVRLGALLTLSLCGMAYAGPEIEPLVDSSSTVSLGMRVDEKAPNAALLDVNQLLVQPRFADMSSTVVADPDLGTREHPMIPLPSSLWAGLLMVAGVAVYAARQQRALRAI